MPTALLRDRARGVIWFACSLALAFAQLVWAQGAPDAQLEALGAAIAQARADKLEALSPTHFEAAVKAHAAAARDLERGRDPARVRDRVVEGKAALDQAAANAANVRKLLEAPWRAREDALSADAPRYAPEAWTKGAERFKDAAIRMERNDLEGAQRRGAESQVLLRDAELIAIKGKVLDEARALIASADEAKVDRYAPRTLQAAKRYLVESEQEITRNRYDLTVAESLAEQARYEARHALYLAQLIQSTLKREREFALEELMLSWEEPLKRIAGELDVQVRFDEGYARPMEELREHVQKQQQTLRSLAQDVRDRDDQIAALNREMQRMEQQLGGVSQERIALQRRVDAQERLRANVAAIEASFTAAEARVRRDGDDVVISLTGIAFPSGRSTISSNNAPLLAKVQRALELFPDAPVVVEGHTDSQGSESANLILSQDRADAVKQYIVSNFARNPERISSIGYGEARPVASNETAEGRARNRRIDLVIRTGAM